MVTYICSDCHFHTQDVKKFVYHLDKKTPCRKTPVEREVLSGIEVTYVTKITKDMVKPLPRYRYACQCRKCGKKLIDEKTQSHHERMCDGTAYSCPFCNVVFNSRQARHNHMAKKTKKCLKLSCNSSLSHVSNHIQVPTMSLSDTISKPII